jgi:phosphatidate cytidylyltransferase
MLRTRIATAVALLTGFLLCLFLLPSIYFSAVVCGVVVIAVSEWAGLTGMGKVSRAGLAVSCVAAFAILVWVLEASDWVRPPAAIIGMIATFFWLIIAPACLARWIRVGNAVLAFSLGIVVILPCALAMVSLHALAPSALLAMLGLIWIADSAAYFTGRAIGKHKLAPHISPGKTWEGAAGALLATLIYAGVLAKVYPPFESALESVGWALYLLATATLCVLSIIGDLFESMLKRNAGVKDSGTLLPGHGGVLDRIDSVTSALPVAALLLAFSGGRT